MDFVEYVRREGKREGEQKGRRDGRAQALLDLLSARFGPVPASVKARVESATEKMLSTWTQRVLTAPTLEALIEDVSPPTRAPRRPQTRSKSLAAKRKGTRPA